ncbi:AAA family ATPase [Pseudomonas sp. 910_21]|uniref:AAA family ATPase n=1 Tax=Pseudomonas sp. 910_21 TaxID=2604460 RepID=UPI00406352B8
MLLRFGTANHLSIRDYQELSLTATSLKDPQEGLLRVTPDVEKGISAVPVVALYGANAAGKSTILRALDFYVAAIRNSQTGATARRGTPYDPFLLDDDSRNEPSRYDADFVIDGIRYHYGFELDGEIINREWLFSFPPETQRQTRSVLFHRQATEEEPFYFGKNLKGDNKRIAKITRENSLFLSAAAQSAHPQLSEIYDYFDVGFLRRFDNIADENSMNKQLSAYFSQDDEQRKRALSFLKAADIGISDIHFKKKPIGEKTKLLIQEFEHLFSKHTDINGLDFEGSLSTVETEIAHAGSNFKSYPIKLQDESSGTKALLQLLGPVFTRLQIGGILVVDELNIALHPLVSHELIRLFSNPDTNPGGAQLIFTTHDTSMLTAGLLRRDQIWFVEKDRVGCTYLYALSSIKIRPSDNFEKGYIEGRFGAIPMFGLGENDYQKIGRRLEEAED